MHGTALRSPPSKMPKQISGEDGDMALGSERSRRDRQKALRVDDLANEVDHLRAPYLLGANTPITRFVNQRFGIAVFILLEQSLPSRTAARIG